MADNWVRTVWLDQAYEAGIKSDRVKVQLSLCKVDPYLITFRDSNKCIYYITNLKEEESKIILIISNGTQHLSSPSDSLLKLSEELSQVDAIYILYSNERNAAVESLQTSSKICGIYTNLDILCNQLSQMPTINRRRRKGFVRNDFSMASLILPADDLSTSSTSTSIISQLLSLESSVSGSAAGQEVDFMYAQMLGRILMRHKSSEKEMIEFCRRKYADSAVDLNVVDEFEDYYDACNAIFWYTRDTFLYRLLNKSLREQDVDTLYALRYFIKDLDFQLTDRHLSSFPTSTSVNDAPIETVYRGQLMINEEFDRKIRHNTGGYFCVCSFLSTTLHKNLAKMYAGNGSSKNETSVLFQIDIDTANRVAYTNISKQSAFEEDENEVLFTMGAVFRITSVNWSDEGIWNVNLKIIDEQDENLYNLVGHLWKNTSLNQGLLSLAEFMYTMSNYDKAESYFLLALQQSTVTHDSATLISIYNYLGLIYSHREEEEPAIANFEKALNIIAHSPENPSSLATMSQNLGQLYYSKGDYENSFLFYKKSLETYLSLPDSDQRSIATCYNNILSSTVIIPCFI
jgi:tetratricopeptide (TPR) repeat protein